MRVSVFLVLLLAAVSVAGASYVVPEGLKFTIFAQGSEPAAQIVVGANAPSITDDSSSAMIIRRAIERKEIPIQGGNVTFEFYGATLTIFDAASADQAVIGTKISVTSYLKKYLGVKDADGKEVVMGGKYNRFILKRAPFRAQMIYEAQLDNRYFLGDPDPFAPGRVYDIGGKKYAVVSTNGEDEVSLAPAILRKTKARSELDKDFGAPLVGDIKFTYVSDGTIRTLYFLKDGNIIGFVDSTQLSGARGEIPEELLPELLTPYRLFVDMSSDTLVLVMVKREDVFTITSGEEDVLGYDRVYVGVSSAPADFSYPGKAGIYFMGKVAELVEGEETPVPEASSYAFDFNEDWELQVRGISKATVASGTLMKKKKYGFLKKDVRVSTVSTLPMPSLEIVTEQEANKSMNLVLIGGPEANELVNELVMSGMSTVDWYSSEGDIEVIENAFGTGSYAVIVAGKDREATRKAAKMLAELLSL